MEGIPMAPDSPADFWDSQKQPPGQFATFAWLLIGVYLFYRHPEAWFLSWQAAVYFVVGMFVAAVVFGWLGTAFSASPRRTLSSSSGDRLKAPLCYPSRWDLLDGDRAGRDLHRGERSGRPTASMKCWEVDTCR
jgi:hypothetical protein